MSLVRRCRRIPVVLLPLIAAVAGCSSDDPVPACINCEAWTQMTQGLGRFPDPHPADPRWIVYSTIEKRPNATDANRESDEDIWLTFRDASVDLAASPKWQLTDDALGAGDNTTPRFSPSGTQLAFARATSGGTFEIWRLPLSVPADPADPPLTGSAELVASDARDPAWASETRLYFARGDKLFRIDVPAGPGAPVGPPLQLTFSPPTFASTDLYIDRHPMFSPDGGAVFNSTGRGGTADVVMKAFEVDDTVYPPDTTETSAWISYQPPGASAPTYPLFIGGDTLRTPQTLTAVPVGSGGIFTLGVRRDSRFLPPLSESYCDTLITIPADLQPGDVDTLEYYFHVVRGTLRITSGIGQVNASWARRDQRESSTFTIDSPGGSVTYSCLMPFQVVAGQIIPGLQEPFLVRGTRGPLADSVEVVLSPGKTSTAALFPAGGVTATLVFPGAPTPLPLASARATLSGTTFLVSTGLSNTQTGVVTIGALPAGSFDIEITVPGTIYRDTTFTGVVVAPPAITDLGTIVLQTGPAGLPSTRTEAGVAAGPAVPEPEHVVIAGGDPGASDNPADLASVFRAEGDAATVWRLEEDVFGRPRLEVTELFGSEFLIQHPSVTNDLGNGLRYVAFSGNDTGEWQLYVQRLQDWRPDGTPVHVLTPGTTDNLSCIRSVFHPRWVPGESPGQLSLLVTLGDCPSNGFEGLGIDDNPWAVGEIRIWRVDLGPDF